MTEPAPTLLPWFCGLDVLDVAASVRFYRDVLGLPLEEVDDSSSDPWTRGRRYQAVWQNGRAVFALFAAMPGAEARGIRVGFLVRDVDRLHRRAVAAGADVLHPPREMPWGRLARYRDPDGNIVGVTQLARPER